MLLHERLEAEVPRAVEDLAALVAIPSIGASPAHRGDVLRSAEAVRRLLEAEGVSARVVSAGNGHPSVIGHKPGPSGSPTVLLYAHHDVQPVGTGSWTSDPFVLQRRGGRVFGRGASDDKAAIALYLAVLRAFGDDLPVTVKLLVEGEEELGSPTLGVLLDEVGAELTADVVVVPDAVNPEPLVPSTTTALRGIADLTVALSTLRYPVHSGLYGGALPCALTSLVQLLASLYDETGAVAVEGLAADPGPAPRVLLDLTGPALVPPQTRPDDGTRVVLAPSVTVLALDAVPVDEASNVLHASARAVLGVRVPPGGDPSEALGAIEAHLERHASTGCVLELSRGKTGRGFRSPITLDAWRRAAGEAFGTASVEVGAGGSIPFLAALQERLPSAHFLVTAVQDAASRAHSHDESLHLAGFRAAVVAHGLLLAELGRTRGEGT